MKKTPFLVALAAAFLVGQPLRAFAEDAIKPYVWDGKPVATTWFNPWRAQKQFVELETEAERFGDLLNKWLEDRDSKLRAELVLESVGKMMATLKRMAPSYSEQKAKLAIENAGIELLVFSEKFIQLTGAQLQINELPKEVVAEFSKRVNGGVMETIERGGQTFLLGAVVQMQNVSKRNEIGKSACAAFKSFLAIARIEGTVAGRMNAFGEQFGMHDLASIADLRRLRKDYIPTRLHWNGKVVPSDGETTVIARTLDGAFVELLNGTKIAASNDDGERDEKISYTVGDGQVIRILRENVALDPKTEWKEVKKAK